METIRVMLVEDHLLVRQGTRELLERKEDIEIVAEAGDGQEAVRLAEQHRPDVILMDIAIPKLNGLEATRQIKAIAPEPAILVLTAYDDDEYVFAFLEAGAAGYLLKDISASDLIKAIRSVHSGESVLHPAITRKVLDYFAGQRPDAQAATVLAPLTGRELDVLKLAARGMTNREIGFALGISARTAQVHLSHVFSKLGVGSRTEAVLCAVRQGWLSLEDAS